jgi:hypothetical protein
VPEPAALVGMNSGQHYATLGDNPMGPETMQVTPPAGAPPVQAAPGAADITLGRERPVSMADGGLAQIGGGWADTLKQPNYGSYSAPQAPAYDPNQYDWLRRSLNMSQEGVLGAQGAQIGARAATLPYQQQQLNAERAVLPYSYGVLQARHGLIPLEQAQLGANRATLGARAASLAAQRGYIGQQQGANAAELADIQATRAARANLPDQVAVAQESQLRNQVDRSLYNRIGVEAPTTVDVEPGMENMLPPGMRAKLKTQADIKTQQARDNAELRANQLANARLAVSMIDTNVNEAELKANEAGLTLDQAKLMVEQAQLGEQRAQLGARAAGYDVNQAQLGESQAELGTQRARLGESQAQYDLSRFKDPELEGYELYTDPVTLQREWVTPAEADQRKFAYSQQQGYERYPQQYAQEQYRQQYQTQQQSQGDPFPGYQPDDFVRLLYNSQVTSISGRADPMEGRIYESLYARYVQRYSPQDAANLAAIDLRGIKDKVAAARQAAGGGGGGGTSATAAAIQQYLSQQQSGR